MAGIFLNKKRFCSFLLFSSLFFLLSVIGYSYVQADTLATSRKGGVAIGYNPGNLSEQAKNLSDTFNKDYGLSAETKAKPAQSKKPILSNKQNKEVGSTGKTKFFSLAPIYKSALSSVSDGAQTLRLFLSSSRMRGSSISKQTAGVFSSIFSPVDDFVSNLFSINVPEIVNVSSVKKSSSSRSYSSSPSVIPAPHPSEASSEGGNTATRAVSNKIDNPQLTNSTLASNINLDSRMRGNDKAVASDITRGEVMSLIRQSDDRNTALIRFILTSPAFAKSPAFVGDYGRAQYGAATPATESDSLSIQQSINNLSRRISVIQENNIRQLDKPAAVVTRSDSDISTLANVTMTGSTITSSSFSGTTGTFTGLLTGADGTFSGDLTVSSELTVSGAGTSTIAGRLLAAKAPTLPHTFSVWNTDTANSNVLDSSILINPSSAVADSNLFGIAVNNNVKFLVDAEGDVFVRNLTATGTVNQANTSISTLTVENTATFGDAVGDSITINSGTIASVNPIAWNLPDSQTSALNFESGLFNIDTSNSRVGIGTSSPYSRLSVAGQIVGQNFVATSTTATSTFAGGMNVAGTAGLTVLQNGKLGVGTASPRAGLHIGTNIPDSASASNDAFVSGVLEIDGDLRVAVNTYLRNGTQNVAQFVGTGIRMIDERMVSFGTGDDFAIGYSDGEDYLQFIGGNALGTNVRMVIGNTGNIGIGTTSPYAKLSVVGQTVAEYFTATSTTATSTFSGGLSITGTGTGLNFGADTLFYQNNERFLTSSTTAAGNLTIGYQSATGLDANGGLYNTGVGYQALGNATSTDYNTALGYQALKGSATFPSVGRNTAVGYIALYSNTTGASNTALGSYSMKNNSTGSYNVAIGQQTLESNNSGGNNIATGYQSLDSNTSGSDNVANGYHALYSNISGIRNIGIGSDTLYFTTSNYNTANGYQALYSNTTGTGNTSNGYQSLYYNTTGAYNVGFGYQSGYGDGTTQDQRSVIDNYATFIGYRASRSEAVASTTVLTNITAIGKNARVGASNSIVLGGTGADAVNVGIGTTSPYARLSVVGETVAEKFTATSTTATSTFAGAMGIATTSPWRTLSVTGSMAVTALTAGAAGDFAVCINNTTKELTNAGATGCVVSSRRFKENISTLDSGLEELMQLKPSKFTYIGQTGEHMGLIAEDVDGIDKRLVEYEADGITPRTVRYLEMSALLIKSIQELNLKVDDLMQASTTLNYGQSPSSGQASDGLFSWIIDKFASVFGISFGQDKVVAKNLCAKKSDGSEVCVDGDQLQVLLDKNNVITQTPSSTSFSSFSSSSSSVGASSSSSSSSISVSSESSSSSILSSNSSSVASSSDSSVQSSSVSTSSATSSNASSAVESSSLSASSSEENSLSGEISSFSSSSSSLSSESSEVSSLLSSASSETVSSSSSVSSSENASSQASSI